MRFPKQLPRLRVKIAHPDLCRISRFRGPDQSFAIGRKARALLVNRRWVQSPRFTATGGHNPQMRNLRVRREIDIFAVEHDPFAIWRRDRCAHALQRHHVFECEWMFGAWAWRRRLREKRAAECKT